MAEFEIARGFILLAAPGSRPPTPAINIGASSGDGFFSRLTLPAPCASGCEVLLWTGI